MYAMMLNYLKSTKYRNEIPILSLTLQTSKYAEERKVFFRARQLAAVHELLPKKWHIKNSTTGSTYTKNHLLAQ